METRGPCAKTVVTCHIMTPDMQHTFYGENDCENPQKVCPRQPNEDYLKCVLICKQSGHAEVMALQQAGEFAKGATAIVKGIKHVCKSCQERLFAAGISKIIIWNPDNEF